LYWITGFPEDLTCEYRAAGMETIRGGSSAFGGGPPSTLNGTSKKTAKREAVLEASLPDTRTEMYPKCSWLSLAAVAAASAASVAWFLLTCPISSSETEVIRERAVRSDLLSGLITDL
jgi:hypothetical protein